MTSLIVASGKPPTSKRALLGLRRQPGRLALHFMHMPLRAYEHDKGHLLGHAFVKFTHIGRRTGKPHEAVAMVLRDEAETGEVVICAAWGPTTDWYRNIEKAPAPTVTMGRTTFTPAQRFLDEDEAFEVGVRFRREHPHRLRLLAAILGWGNLRDDAQMRAFVRRHPFVGFRPIRLEG